jgi:hypothetical protein
VEEVLVFVVQFFLEFVLQIFGSFGFDVATTRSDRKEQPGCGWLTAFAIFGGVCGGLSLIFAPNAILPNAGLRIANLFVAPLLAGGVSFLAASLWSSRGWEPSHHFWRGFWFALFFGLVRFAYLHR